VEAVAEVAIPGTYNLKGEIISLHEIELSYNVHPPAAATSRTGVAWCH
jgi:hypothetical protein